MNTLEIYTREAVEQDMISVTSLHETAYSNAGYMPKHASGMDSTHPTNSQTVIIACFKDEYEREHIIGTVSMTEYNNIGFSPLSSDFPDALQKIALKEKSCVLIWRFAIKEDFRHSLNITFLLIKAAIEIGWKHHFITVVCAIHPKHYIFYRKGLGFKKVDECINLSGLINAPAYLLLGTFEKAHQQFNSFYSKKKGVGPLTLSGI